MAAPRNYAAVRAGEPPNLLARALAALDSHSASFAQRDVIAVADFAAQSSLPRLQLIDIGNGRILSTHLVSHGRGSDPGNSGWVERFSNVYGSNASCRGAFVTGGAYVGKHGRSRRLHGLDPDNSNAAGRGIVIHAAKYVNQDIAANLGRVGRSQGCFAVSNADIAEVLDKLGPGRLLFAGR
ncbi:MAG: murein L,D-transpeptidase catalytic domain family protein [Novosphingobium sp.]